MSRSEIAVVITCSGQGRTLRRAIESIEAQTLTPEELVLVDGGSSDPLTVHVLSSLDESDTGPRVLRGPSPGLAALRNYGIAATEAPLVVVLDAADVFDSTYLEQAGELLDTRPDLSFVSCAVQTLGVSPSRFKPPPLTLAAALARGECAHSSTVFRREVWQRNGGFDEALPDYHNVDFWLRAIEHGFHGATLDQALIRCRAAERSHDDAPITPDRHVVAKRKLLDKHLHSATPRGEDLFAAMLGLEQELTAQARAREEQSAEIRTTLATTEAELARAHEALHRAGADPVELGRIPTDRAQAAASVEHVLIDDALSQLAPPVAPARTLTLRPGDQMPRRRGRFDLVIVVGRLECEADPISALAECRAMLRAGGELLVAVPAVAFGPERHRGFSEGSLRALLCELFGPSRVEVTSVGNLITTMAAVAGVPAEELTRDELEVVDPEHATVIIGSGREPATDSRTRRRKRGEPARRSLSANRFRRSAVLAYPNLDLSVEADGFALQMEFIAKNCRPLTLVELAAAAASGMLVPGSVALTFDGGRSDHLDRVSPVLAELEIPGTFFIAEDAIDGQAEGALSEDELLELSTAPGHLLGTLGPTTGKLERLQGRPVKAMAYAGGRCDRAAVELADRDGFTVACTLEHEPVTCDSDPLRLPRLEIGDDDIHAFKFKLERMLGAHQ